MPAKPALQEKLDSEDEFLATVAAWALAQVHPECPVTAPRSVPLLIKAVEGPDPALRLEAIGALQCLGPLAKDATGALEKAAESDDPEVSAAADKALEAIKGA
jgi:HEAT repeat protein